MADQSARGEGLDAGIGEHLAAEASLWVEGDDAVGAGCDGDGDGGDVAVLWVVVEG